MSLAYFDTNVFVASYKLDDVYHGEASLILSALERGEIRGETSTLTILETAAVAGGIVAIHKTDNEAEIRSSAVARAILGLSKLGLSFVHIPGDSSAPIDGRKVEMPAVFHQALLLGPLAGLKSFDLVHLAAAKYSRLAGSELGAFVTGDSDFLRKKKDLSRIVCVPILSPKEYVEGLGLA